MSQDLQAFLKSRAHVGESRLWPMIVVALLLHAGACLPFFLMGRGTGLEEAKVTWVSLPAAVPSGPSGGSAGTEEGVEKAERLRRADEVAPQRTDAKAGSLTQQDPFAQRKSSAAIKGNNPDQASRGTNTTAAKTPTPNPNPQGGAAGSGGGGGVGAGEGIPGLKASTGVGGGNGLISDLGGAVFPFPVYLETIQGKITSNWSRISASPGRVQIYFRIRRDGQVERVRVEVPSPHENFNTAARMAVLRAAPLPRLPDGYDEDYLEVRFWFTYTGN